MSQRKPDEGKTQRQKFVEAARELGIDEKSDEAFCNALRAVAKAHSAKPKKAARKPNR